MNNMSARQMRNVQLDENLTKRVYTAFDSVSLIGFLKLLISRSEWAVSKDVFSKRRIATFGFIPLNMNFGNFFFFCANPLCSFKAGKTAAPQGRPRGIKEHLRESFRERQLHRRRRPAEYCQRGDVWWRDTRGNTNINTADNRRSTRRSCRRRLGSKQTGESSAAPPVSCWRDDGAGGHRAVFKHSDRDSVQTASLWNYLHLIQRLIWTFIDD